jgi:hypothetical protein
MYSNLLIDVIYSLFNISSISIKNIHSVVEYLKVKAQYLKVRNKGSTPTTFLTCKYKATEYLKVKAHCLACTM